MKTVEAVKSEIKETEAKIWHGSVWRFLEDGHRLYIRGTPERRYIDTAQTVLKELFDQCSFNVMGFSALCYKPEDASDRSDYMAFGAQHHFLPDPYGGKDDFVLNFRKFEISPDHFRIVSRPTPISFRLGHIFDRYRQRVHEEFPMGELNSAHGVALIIAEEIDKKMKKEKLLRLPFVFPTETGLFLGIAESASERISYHDFYLLETANKFEKDKSPYQWIPKTKMNVYTFIGRDQMFPDQRRLHDILKPYVVRDDTEDRQRSIPALFGYLSLSAENQGLPKNELGEAQLNENIARLIDSKLWKNAVRFPTSVLSAVKHFHR